MIEERDSRTWQDGLFRRLKAFVFAGGAAMVGTSAPFLLLEGVRPDWTRGALLWWGEPGVGLTLFYLAIIVLPFAAVAAPGAFLSLKRIAIWTAGLALTSTVLVFVVEGRPAAALWPDRLERRSAFVEQVLSFDQVVRIDVECRYNTSRRSEPWPSIEYEVIGSEGAPFRLTAAKESLRTIDTVWLDRVAQLDGRLSAAGAPRFHIGAGRLAAQGRQNCMTLLENQLDPVDLARARQILGQDSGQAEAIAGSLALP